ncbi:MAG: ATPase, T2SS/T4P/T4SS family, partial [Actinomycetota bacterium]
MPSEEPGGFTPAPSPDAEEAPATDGWSYSYVAEPVVPVAPVDDPLDDPLDVTQPLAAVEPAESAPSPFFAGPPLSPPDQAPLQAEPVPAQPVAFEPQAPAVAPFSKPAPATTLVPEQTSPVGQPPSLEPTADSVGIAESEAEEGAYERATTEAGLDAEDVSLNDLLMIVLDRGASDLHMTSGARPSIRLNGELAQLDDQPILTPPVIQRVMYAALTQKQREKFEENLELDFAYSVPGRARFRVNMYRQRDAIGAAFRIIPFEIKKLEDLGVPPSVSNFASLPRGFVLVTGPTGSGKSTTLAALIDLANRTRREHIMTVEDPIEFLHRHQQCIVNQREVGED